MKRGSKAAAASLVALAAFGIVFAEEYSGAAECVSRKLACERRTSPTRTIGSRPEPLSLRFFTIAPNPIGPRSDS